jgi:hypothetical protein
MKNATPAITAAARITPGSWLPTFRFAIVR